MILVDANGCSRSPADHPRHRRRARDLIEAHQLRAARDAMHAATVIELGLDAICSDDRGLDVVPGLRRVEPAALLGH